MANEANDRLLAYIRDKDIKPSASQVVMKDGVREFHIWVTDPIQPE